MYRESVRYHPTQIAVRPAPSLDLLTMLGFAADRPLDAPPTILPRAVLTEPNGRYPTLDQLVRQGVAVERDVDAEPTIFPWRRGGSAGCGCGKGSCHEERGCGGSCLDGCGSAVGGGWHRHPLHSGGFQPQSGGLDFFSAIPPVAPRGQRQAVSADIPLGGSEELIAREMETMESRSAAILRQIAAEGFHWTGPVGTQGFPDDQMDYPRAKRLSVGSRGGDGCGGEELGQLVAPAEEERGGSCSTSSAPESCGFVALRQTTCDGFECDGAGRNAVVVNNCSSEAEDFVRDAWCLLYENIDILQWASCIVYGDEWMEDLAAKVEGFTSERGNRSDLLLRVEFRCDNGAAWSPWAGPCPDFFALSWPDGFGGFVHFCTDRLRFRRWIDMADSICAGDRLCALVDAAAYFAHELTHVVYTFRSADTYVGTCENSYMYGNIVRWALLRRYPAAMSSNCCAQLRDGSAIGAVVDPAMFGVADETATFDASECDTCS